MTYAIDDEFGNEITTGLVNFDSAMQCAKRYLSAHADATGVRIYESADDGDEWDLTREDVLS